MLCLTQEGVPTIGLLHDLAPNHLDFTDDQQRRFTVASHQVCDVQVRLPQSRTRVVPSDYLFPGCSSGTEDLVSVHVHDTLQADLCPQCSDKHGRTHR